MSRILAIDFGTKRIGLAVTDPDQIIATPLDTIDNPKIYDFLQDYFSREKVELIIVGFPERSDGSRSEIQEKILTFVQKLQKQFNKEVVLFDERYTSKLAFQAMIDGGLKKKKRRDKAMIDRISATILLQDYLKTIEK
ncbi:MAG: Holliday junction resolvase RuvX [Bacteroidales bacterium]|nr:Holliday junction resolvase RuvX [Bacteroidales bacterium]